MPFTSAATCTHMHIFTLPAKGTYIYIIFILIKTSDEGRKIRKETEKTERGERKRGRDRDREKDVPGHFSGTAVGGPVSFSRDD